MGARNREGNSLKFYALKAKVDADNNPYFALSEKVNGKWTITETFNEVFGEIKDFKITDKEFNGVESKIYNITLQDDEGETSVIQMTQNQITYSIINTLLSLDNFNGEFSISVYKTEDKAENGKVYYNGKAYITMDGERLEWALHPKDEVPKPSPVMNGKKPFKKDGRQVYDHTEVEEFWLEKFEEIQDKFKAKNSDPENTEDRAFSGERKETHGKVDTSSEDDLPF